jgi:hypothetical protein
VELHTVAWNRTSGHLRAETLAMEASKQKVSTCVGTSNNRGVPDGNTSAADRISGVRGTSSENEHSKVNSNSECFGPYKGEYDNLLFFFCYMYSKIHKLYKHDDLRAYKRPLK